MDDQEYCPKFCLFGEFTCLLTGLLIWAVGQKSIFVLSPYSNKPFGELSLGFFVLNQLDKRASQAATVVNWGRDPGSRVIRMMRESGPPAYVPIHFPWPYLSPIPGVPLPPYDGLTWWVWQNLAHEGLLDVPWDAQFLPRPISMQGAIFEWRVVLHCRCFGLATEPSSLPCDSPVGACHKLPWLLCLSQILLSRRISCIEWPMQYS